MQDGEEKQNFELISNIQGHRLERVKFTDTSNTLKCPDCQCQELKQLVLILLITLKFTMIPRIVKKNAKEELRPCGNSRKTELD